MIVGHFGLAGLMHGWLRRAPMWWLVPAAVAPDLLDVAYAALGVCSPYGLYSHTLPAVVLLAACIGGAALLVEGRECALGCLMVALLHPALDFVTGNKLYWPGGELHGLHLYDHHAADFAVESAMLFAGWWVLRATLGRPPWSRSLLTLGALVMAQGTWDAVGTPIKPTGCARGAAAVPLFHWMAG